MTIQELRDEVKELWIKACNYQGVDEDEKFICFENDNPFLKEYDKKMKLYQFARKAEILGKEYYSKQS